MWEVSALTHLNPLNISRDLNLFLVFIDPDVFLPAKMIYWTNSKTFSKDESFTHINKYKNIRNGFKNRRIPLYYANEYAERLTEDRR